MEKDRKIEEVMERRMEVIIGYLKAYREKYSLDTLKKKILESGYTPGELEQALETIGLVQPAAPTRVIKTEQNGKISKEKLEKPKLSSASRHEVFNEIESLAKKRLEEKTEQKNEEQ